MSDTGFCCRCGKETERKEQVGLIVGWVCSTSCSFKASQEFARPPTPELDKYRSAMPFLRVMSEFLDWLNLDEQGVALCTYKRPNPSKPLSWSPAEASHDELLNRFFNIEPEKLEAERKMLESKILEFQKRADSRRPT